MQTFRPYTPEEEIWSSIIHGIGAALSIAGLVVLVMFSAIYGDAWSVVSTAVFGTSMIVLYTASTVYHAVPNPEIKKRLKKFDHISIYYLIADSYTPFLLVTMRGTTGWTVFGIVWGLALIGTFLRQRHQNLVNRSLSADGMDDYFRLQRIIQRAADNRADLFGSRRPFLYIRNFLLCLEK